MSSILPSTPILDHRFIDHNNNNNNNSCDVHLTVTGVEARENALIDSEDRGYQQPSIHRSMLSHFAVSVSIQQADQ